MPRDAIGFDALPGIVDAPAGSLLAADGSGKAAWVLPKLAFVASSMSINGDAGWGEGANGAYLFPFTVFVQQSCAEICIYKAATLSGNYDVGIYTLAGSRLTSKGSTAQSTLTGGAAGRLNRIAVPSATLPPGQYWMALACDNTTGTWSTDQPAAGQPPIAAAWSRSVAASFPLPATITPGSTVPLQHYPMGVTLT